MVTMTICRRGGKPGSGARRYVTSYSKVITIMNQSTSRWPLLRVSMLTMALSAVSLPALSTATPASAPLQQNHQHPQQQDKQSLTLSDIMQFREIKGTELSIDGRWLAYAAIPDRGDATGYVQSSSDDTRFEVPRGVEPQFDDHSQWVAFTVKQPLLALEQASKKEKKKLQNALTLVKLSDGEQLSYERVESYALSDNGDWLAVRFYPVEKDTKKDNNDDKDKEDKDKDSKPVDDKDKPAKLFNKDSHGHALALIDLRSRQRLDFDNVAAYAFGHEKGQFTYAVSTKDGHGNQLVNIDLDSGDNRILDAIDGASFTHLSWNDQANRLAFLQGDYQAKTLARTNTLYQWRTGKKLRAVTIKQPKWFVPSENELHWSDNGQRLFFGLRPVVAPVAEVDLKVNSTEDLFDLAKIRGDKELQIWHGQDPLIKPNQAVVYDKEQKRHYQAIFDAKRNKVVRLADETVRNVNVTEHQKAFIAKADVPYLRERTWAGFYNDVYKVDIKTGKQTLIKTRLASSFDVELSPDGRYAAYYDQGHFWLYDSKKDRHHNLSQGMSVNFADEDHDYPSAPDGYGIAGWLDNGKGFIAYDKFDIWLFNTKGKPATLLTKGVGRDEFRQLRIVKTDDDQLWIDPKQPLLLSSYHDKEKHHGFYQLDLTNKTVTKLVEDKKKFAFVAKANEAETMIFTREDFNEFPDLWLSPSTPEQGKKVTDINPQKDHFLWGTPELVDWRSTNGEAHQGILIKPANYQPGQQYPVLVYYYRLYSQRMYHFNQMKVNHRPNFPYYTSNGYAIFLPDVHFQVGTPGHSTAKSIVPGVQKLIDMGIADPDAIGLHGHSWSGYQTAFTITETDMFKAAVAGAPVTNMTSAYSGIRHKSGLARQFQYETGQSRIGGSLWDKRDLYIENSPVFYADRINTPLLMQFGDVDGAVPWEQGIEMYLAMRRLDKPVIFLQYEGEPHHLKKYPNKVDYTIKMKEFFDHHLKGAPAPLWMTDGVPYTEESKEK